MPFDGHNQDQASGLDVQSVDNVGYTQGQLDEAACFDGSDDDGDQRADCFEIADSPLLQASDAFSICAWVKADQAEGYQTLLNKWYVLDSYSLGLINDELVLSVSYPNGSWGDVYDIRTPMPVGTWTHVVGVLDGNTLSLYLNGDCVATATTPGGTIQASGRPVVIGDHPNGSGYQGCMDELYFYTTALNAGQINYLAERIHQPDDSRTFSVQALLQGPFSTQTATMDNALVRSGSLPFDSPFDESYWTSEGMPDSLVDWVWLELLPQVDAEPAWQTSALISVNGWLCTPEGSAEFATPCRETAIFCTSFIATICPHSVPVRSV